MAERREQTIGMASIFLASGTVVSRVLGFVKAMVLAAVIGVNTVGGNAFAVANQLPNTLYTIIAGGVVSAILVPQIVRAMVHEDRGQAYINKLLTIAFVVLGTATIAATAAAAPLTAVYASGGDPRLLELAIAMAFWCIPQLFFYGLYTVLGEILNAHKLFGPFTWAPAVNNIVAMAGLGAFAVLYGTDPAGAWSVGDWTVDRIVLLSGTATLGVVAQALVLVFFWRRIDLRFRFDFRWRGVGFRRTGKLAGWSFAMILVTTLGGIAQVNILSTVPDRFPGVAALQNAWLLFMLPHSVITLSLVTAYFTRMAEHVRGGDLGALKGDVNTAIRQVLLMMTATTALLIAVAVPFAMLFVRDSYEGTVGFAAVLVAYLLSLVPFSVLFVFQRTFYALGDTRTPFFFTVAQTIVFAGLAATCLLLPLEARGVGVALAMSASIVVQTLLAGVLLRRRMDGIGVRRIAGNIVRFTVMALPAGAAGVGAVAALGAFGSDGFAVSSLVAAVVTMAVAAIVVGLVYVGTLFLTRTPEILAAGAWLGRRLRRR